MKNHISEEARLKIEEEIERIAQKMVSENEPEELDKLEKKYKMLSSMLEKKWKISPDTIALIGANLLGILLILNHERLNIISTKAFNMVSRIRV